MSKCAVDEGKTHDLVDLLRLTLEQLETDTMRADDPAMVELKRRIVRAIAELRVEKDGKAAGV